MRIVKKALAKFIINQDPLSAYFSSTATPHVRSKVLNQDVLLQFWAYTQTDYFSERELRELQFEKLKHILVHAGRTVPYWHRMFGAIHFQPEGMKNFDAIGQIPVSTRAHIKSIPIGDLLSERTGFGRRAPRSTAGSTGEPLNFFHDTHELPSWRAIFLLVMHYAGFKHKTPILNFGLDRYHPLQGFAKNIAPANALESKAFRVNTLYPLLISYQPQIIHASLSVVRRFADHLRSDGFYVGLTGVITMGESIPDAELQELARIFQCPLTDHYGARECYFMGIRCLLGNYHLLPWFNYIEIVGEDGKNCPNGQEGNVTVTSFGNEVMPFIRYQTGDRGFISGDRCDCGRKSRCIVFRGRAPSFIRLPGGEQITVRFLENFLEEFGAEIKKFQIEQRAANSLLIRYIANRREKPLNEIMVRERLTEALRRHAQSPYNIQITLERVDAILPNEQGKTPLFISRI
mgnify:FL=1